jgi:hypothetical protein
MAIHAAVLAAMSTADEARHAFASLQAVPGLGLLKSALEPAQSSVAQHYSAATRVFQQVTEAHDDAGIFQPLDDHTRPIVGFSSFRWLSRSFNSERQFTHSVRDAGRRGIKLYPNLVHGGTAAAWAKLYPDKYGVRMNHSVGLETASTELAALDRVFPAQAGTRV